MKPVHPTLLLVAVLVLACPRPLNASVTVSAPGNGAVTFSPVRYAASATASSCPRGVASIGVYVNNQLAYMTSTPSLGTSLALSPGRYHTVVQEWDFCGGATSTPVDITVVPGAPGGAPGGVAVASPANHSTVSSPVTYTATATSPTCAQGIASMGVYVNNTLRYVTQGTQLNTQLALASGPQGTVVQAWDHCGGTLSTPVAIQVQGSTPPLQGVVKHVFVIMLENEGFARTFGGGSPAPFLSQTLAAQGQLLTSYYGIGHNSLDNYVAMISGQAPDPETQGDCPVYQDVLSSNTFAANGQLVGRGCVYPASVSTLANQLQTSGRTWHAYMESMPSPCLRPSLNASDPYQGVAANGYATRHNPFVYFHALIDSTSCQANDLPLTRMAHDLSAVASTPNLSYIVPNICHDGHDAPCRDGEPGGLVSADAFLKQWVPVILSSPAYKQDGLLIVTFDEADSAAQNYAQACCNETPGPNAAQPGITGPGGGLVGAVVLSPFAVAGSRNPTPYNHYALLKTIENIFGLPYLGYAQPASLQAFGKDVLGLAP